MLLTTRLTPSTRPAISSARCFWSGVSTKPLSCTTLLNVFTSTSEYLYIWSCFKRFSTVEVSTLSSSSRPTERSPFSRCNILHPVEAIMALALHNRISFLNCRIVNCPFSFQTNATNLPFHGVFHPTRVVGTFNIQHRMPNEDD